MEVAEVAGAGNDHSQRLFLGQEWDECAKKGTTFDGLLAGETRFAGNLVLTEIGERLLVIALELRFFVRLDLRWIAKQNEFAGELSLIFVEVLLALQLHLDRSAANRTIGR